MMKKEGVLSKLRWSSNLHERESRAQGRDDLLSYGRYEVKCLFIEECSISVCVINNKI